MEIFNVSNEKGINPISLKQTLENNDAEGVVIEADKLVVTADTFSGGLGNFLQLQGYSPVQTKDDVDGGETFIIHDVDNVSRLQEVLEMNGTGIELKAVNLKVLIQSSRRYLKDLFVLLGHEVVN